ncbi:MAG TPA: TIGR03790 family protein, partial [Burkholderiales bacterium]|nr:TIGR03790 family protein [Burkholderiales bacterium]
MLCFPAWALDHRELALVVNTLDPLSVEIGKYYARKRKIDFQNVVRVAFEPKAALSKEEFELIKQQVDEQVRPQVQAFALAWAAPWRVECMSITSAFAFGFDPASCAWGCKPTPFSRYFASATRAPYAELGIRPAMALAAASLEEAKALIDRGVAADGTHPEGAAYLLITPDAARSVRSPGYLLARRVAKGRIPVKVLQQDTLTYRTDVLFYFTGA